MNYWHILPIWRRFRRGKNSEEILIFHAELEQNLAGLAADLHTGAYQHSGYRERVIADKKERRLLIASVRDRLVHRLIYERLISDFDHRFDPDVYSGRVGKGLDKALCRTQTLLKRRNCIYAWRTDIYRFFDNIRHDTLLKLTGGHPLHRLCYQVIKSYETENGCGIPIGNLTSQIFANIYLNEFDRYVRHCLRPCGYVRYGDDMLLLFPTRRAAFQAEEQGAIWLKDTLGLEINPKNTYVGSSDKLHFLGHVITNDTIEADAVCIKKALKCARYRNLGSYQNLRLPAEIKDALNRQVLVEIETEMLKNAQISHY